ncbi:MAG: GNAT family N-acetyltransferase [Elusimicrobiales bacterium]|nr:GNAT family N-acetyltransferase [Elusimicrobiales bacterium]
MPLKKIERVLRAEGRPDVVIRLAKVQDMRRIQMLYAEVYGGTYSVPIVTDKEKMRRAIEDDEYYWLVAECQGRVVGSLVYALDLYYRNSKAFGAVVSQEFRKLDLAYTMMKLVLDDITHNKDLVDLVYATTRTANYAPQKLTESLGFIKLGIFPNTHKVQDNETHCLTGYFTERALQRRRQRPRIIPEVEPFYDIVRRQISLDRPQIKNVQGDYSDHKTKIPLLNFEAITAPEFVKHRWRKTKSKSFFEHIFMPFHEPNLILITPDQGTEVFLTFNQKDKYSVLVGGVTDQKSFAVVMESVAQKVSQMDMAYVEVIIDAYSPAIQRDALDARFIPSAYFPCAKRMGGKRYDCIVFSRTFDILDFRNVKIISLYKNFLKEYLKLWRENYIELVFKTEQK